MSILCLLNDILQNISTPLLRILISWALLKNFKALIFSNNLTTDCQKFLWSMFLGLKESDEETSDMFFLSTAWLWKHFTSVERGFRNDDRCSALINIQVYHERTLSRRPMWYSCSRIAATSFSIRRRTLRRYKKYTHHLNLTATILQSFHHQTFETRFNKIRN